MTEMSCSPFWSLGGPRPRHRHGLLLVFWFVPAPAYCALVWWDRPEGHPRVPFPRALIPFVRAPSSWPNLLPEPHLLILSPWALGFQQMYFGEHIQIIAECMLSLPLHISHWEIVSSIIIILIFLIMWTAYHLFLIAIMTVITHIIKIFISPFKWYLQL